MQIDKRAIKCYIFICLNTIIYQNVLINFNRKISAVTCFRCTIGCNQIESCIYLCDGAYLRALFNFNICNETTELFSDLGDVFFASIAGNRQ